MDILEFLRHLVPDESVLYTLVKRGHGMVHEEHHSLSDMAQHIAATGRSHDVYFALASYEPRRILTSADGEPVLTSRGNPKYQYRTHEQVKHLKAFWLDVDVGEGKDYATQQEALQELAAFIRAAALPVPLIVNSGGGLHVYWPLQEMVERQDWMPVARALKTACERLGFKADPSRTSDPSSILRPLGGFNFKYNPPKPVEVLTRGTVAPVTIDTMRAALAEHLVAELELDYDRSDDNLGELNAFSMSDPELIAQRCAVMKECADTRGNVSEPLWRGMIGVLKFCYKGEQYAHEWSKGHPNYSYAETAEKLARYQGGPTTCQYFEAHSDKCATCKYRGRFKTPARLGTMLEEEVEQPKPESLKVEVHEVVMPSGDTRRLEQTIEVPTPPQGFELTPDNRLFALQKDESGEVRRLEFSTLLWFPFARIRRDDGTFAYRCKVIKGDAAADFEIEASDLPSTATLLERLASMEIFTVNNKKARELMHTYAVRYCSSMVNNVKPVHTYDQFGWDEHLDGFVLGNAYITPNGVEQCILSGNAEAKAIAFTKLKDDPTPWVTAVEAMYNRVDMLPMQYALLSGFGSLLGRFTPGDAYAGIPCALTSSDSGIGKTTVAKLALAAFGDWREMFLSSTGGATKMARISTISTMGNLPVLLDELTDIPPAELVELLYSISNGRERQRLEQTGALRKTSSWNSSVYITANENLINKLSAMKVDTEANQVRVFEIDLTSYPIPKLDPTVVDKAVEAALRSRGAVGFAYIDWLVKNRVQVERVMHDVEAALMQHSVFKQPRLRFFRYHAMCSLTAGYILQALGFIKFDMAAVTDWAVNHVASLANLVQDNKSDASSGENLIDDLIRSLSGGGNLLYTATYGSRGKSAVVLQEPRQELKARLTGTPAVDADKSKYDGSLLVVKTALKDWCAQRRMGLREFFNRLPEGAVIADNVNVKLSAYTSIPSAVSRCVWIDVRGLIDLDETLEEAVI